MNLTFFQRIKRRFGLWGGSYKHPDGTIELDFDEKAGIDPTVDSQEVQDEKFDRYMKQQRDNSGGTRGVGALMIAFALYLLAAHMGLEGWKLIAVPILFAVGLPVLITGRWKDW